MSDRLDAAFDAQPRSHFLPASVRAQAWTDAPLPIGYGQTNSQPTTVRNMLELLDVREGMRVLEVGAGTGWVTALLAELTGPTGSVLGTERIAPLVAQGAAYLHEAGLAHARLVESGDALGAPDDAPFDRILVSAMARRLPRSLVAQLRPGGVMVAPVAGAMVRVVRGEPPHDGVDEAQITRHGGYRFVPLVEG